MVIYYRITYGMQFIAALNVVIALFLVWHTRLGTGFDLITRPLDDFIFPYSFASQWWLLWLILPPAFTNIVRSGSGLFDYQVPWRLWAIGYSGISLLVLLWFYLAYGDQNLQIGFWLTTSSLMLLTLLIATEWLLPTRDPRLARLEQFPSDDPTRIWEGHFRICPSCGNPNKPDVRRCEFCGIMLFPEEKG